MRIVWALIAALVVIVAIALGFGAWVAVWSFLFMIRFAVIGLLILLGLYLIFRAVRNVTRWGNRFRS